MTIEEAWARIHDAKPAGWTAAKPSYDPYRVSPWSRYAFDATERPKLGRRSRRGTATAMTEKECLEEMARCLAEIGQGRVPR